MTEVKQPTCRSCRIRYEVGVPEVQDFEPWKTTPHAFRWVENAARWFDLESRGRRFTASEFVDWIRPEVVTRSVKHES